MTSSQQSPLAGVPDGSRPVAAVTAFFLGGTISMPAGEAGAVVRLDADQLLAATPQLAEYGVQVEAHQLRRLPSPSLTFADIIDVVGLAASCRSNGVVVVQGTDTLEETSYLIDLLWTSDVPIVVTGAMRTPTAAGADGSANLLAAVAVAASDDFRGLGALVAFGDEVHAARHVRKTHTTLPNSFCSPNGGPIGVLAEGRPVRLLGLSRRPAYPAPTPRRWPRVPLIAVGLDDDDQVVRALAGHCEGAVLLGLGGGHVPRALLAALSDLAKTAPVILASRVLAGPILTGTYGYTGSERDLLDRGLIAAGFLDGYKARVLLRLLVALGTDRAEIAAAFAEAGGADALGNVSSEGIP